MPSIEPGWASLMLSIWIVGGFILISMGIVGNYIGQIYSETEPALPHSGDT
ncbi:MAG: hypothetical protein J6W38_01175 [Prevotella sp.]|nr:hypothetical protein [Prevotella sp.]